MQNSVSNKELAALRMMRDFLMKNGRMPSVRELMKEMDYKSPRSAAVIFQNLIDKEILAKKEDGSIQFIQYVVYIVYVEHTVYRVFNLDNCM